jgi:hypothetical protein
LKSRSSIIAAVLVLGSQAVNAGAATDFSVNINLGNPAPVIVTPPPPPPVEEPAIYIDSRPSFIYSPALGFYVSVGSPYDIVYVDRYYYLNRGGRWYASASCQGPWNVVRKRLPERIRRFRYEEIRQHRDREYGSYVRDRDHYRGRWHKPEGEWKERRGHRGENRHEGREEREEHGGKHEGHGRRH